MKKKQALVVIGMAAGLAVAVLAWHFLPPVKVAEDMIARLKFAAECLLVPGFTLLIGIGAVANRRFFLTDAIDGGEDFKSRGLDIALRYNRNTLEQVVLVVIAWPLLAVSLPAERVGMLAVLALLFGIGRAAFWLGYLYAPWARAFGFALTFYPTVAAYLWLGWRMI